MLRAALGFFTRLPIGSTPLPPTFRGVAAWLPVVGLIVGTLVAVTLWLAARVFPAPLCGVLGCLVWVGVTGDVFGCLIELTECAVLVVCTLPFGD